MGPKAVARAWKKKEKGSPEENIVLELRKK